ncbi:MAG: response regulator transcription factor [Bacteroidia bacterium]|nr:response regulator transcription factor [Bacteroidia bacterium]
MRIAVVDDNPVNLNSFAQKIRSFPELELSISASNGHEFMEAMKRLPASHWPAVVFMDIQMPEMDGIATIRLAKAIYHSVHFIVLTVFEDDETIFEAIRSGASGYILKHEDHLTIHDAIREITEFGGAPMSPAIARKALKLLSKQDLNREGSKGLEAIEELLSDREREVLTHMVNGYDAKRIAELTSISPLTVRKHIANIYTKLHVNSKAQVITMAHKNRWV